MNILIICYDSPDKGGLSINAHITAKSLKCFGHRVVIASTENYPGVKTFIFKKYHKNPIFILNQLYLSNFLKKIIKEENIDIIHVQDRSTTLGALRAAKKSKVPCVVHFHDYWFACPKGILLKQDLTECRGANFARCAKCMISRRFFWELYKFYFLVLPSWKQLEKADTKIAVSKKVAEKLRWCGIQKNLIILYNPVLDIFFKPISENDKTRIKNKYRLNKFVISYFGALTKHKGIFVLAEIMKRFKNMADISFLVAGLEEVGTNLLDYIKKNNLNNVVFLSHIPPEDMINIYAVSDIVLIPSIWQEPFSRVVGEAFASSVPVIASNVGGPRELIKHGKTGFLVDPQNIQEWEKKIINLITNSSLRQQFKKNAKQDAVKRFRENIIIQELIKIYKQTINRYHSKSVY